MSDTKVLRLVKKTEGELPEKAFTAQAVAAPEPKPKPERKPARERKLAPVTAIKSVPRRGSAKPPQPQTRLSREEMLKIFRTMYLSRRLDDKEIQMKGQNRIFFQISGAGHEAILVAAGMSLKPGYDWFYPYYRDRALCLQLGMTPLEMLLQSVGAEADPNSHGRQMPSHWGHKKLNIVSQSSPTGTQLLQAVGCAEAGYRIKLVKEMKKRGPSFVHAKVIRPYSHSLSDDEKLYRPDEERASDAEHDPIKRFAAQLVKEKVISQDELQQLKDEIDRELSEAADKALASPQPAPETATQFVYSPDVDPTSKA